MVEELGSEILTEPNEIIAFVASTLGVGETSTIDSDSATTRRRRRRRDVDDDDEQDRSKGREEEGTNRLGEDEPVGFFDKLRIVQDDDDDDDESSTRHGRRVRPLDDDDDDDETEFGGAVSASGKDEMVLTAVTLLLAVLEGEYLSRDSLISRLRTLCSPAGRVGGSWLTDPLGEYPTQNSSERRLVDDQHSSVALDRFETRHARRSRPSDVVRGFFFF